MFIAIILSLIVIGVSSFVYSRRQIKYSIRSVKTHQEIPGNHWRFPIGDTYDNLTAYSATTIKNLIRYAEDQVFLFWVVHLPLVTSFNPEFTKQLLTKPEETYLRQFGNGYIKIVLGKSILAESGENWKKQHRILQKAFSPNNVTLFFSTIFEATRSLVQKLEARAQQKELFDLGDYFHELALEVITRVGFGSNPQETKEVTEIFKNLLHFVKHPILRIPGFSYLWFLEENKMFWKYYNRLVEISRNVLNRRREYRTREKTHPQPQSSEADVSSAPKTSTFLIDLLLDAKDEETSASLSDEEVIDNIITFLLAGSETTSTSMIWFVYHVKRNPKIHQKLMQELDNQFPAKDKRSFYDQISLESLSSCTYLLQCIYESLRLHPPVGLLALRQPLEDLVIGEWKIPKGVPVNMSPMLTHHSAKNFPEPEKFDPERWVGSDRQMPYTYVPFGAGRRVCIGKYLALLELKIGLSIFLKLFDYELVTTTVTSTAESLSPVEPCSPTDARLPFIDIEWAPPLVHPKGGLPTKLSIRNLSTLQPSE